jgi:repressor of nif and glnA expression
MDFLGIISIGKMNSRRLGVPVEAGIKGNRVRIPDGPATVSGERLSRCH